MTPAGRWKRTVSNKLLKTLDNPISDEYYQWSISHSLNWLASGIQFCRRCIPQRQSASNYKEANIDQLNNTSSNLELSHQTTDIRKYHDNSAKFNLICEIQCEFDWSMQNVTISIKAKSKAFGHSTFAIDRIVYVIARPKISHESSQYQVNYHWIIVIPY